MVKEIGNEVKGHLSWLLIRFKSLSVKLIGFVVTCWLVIACLWIGLVLPVNWVRERMVHGNEARIVMTKQALKKQANSFRVLGGSGISLERLKMKHVIQDTTNTLNELKRLGNGVESLAKQ